jgi:hypothetical protein
MVCKSKVALAIAMGLQFYSLIVAQDLAKSAADINYPGANTFFPLLPGSFWRYAEMGFNGPLADRETTHEVTSLVESDSGWNAVVTYKRSSQKPFQIYYWCGKGGQVYTRVREGDPWELTALLHPKIGDSIPDEIKPSETFRYLRSCGNDASQCIVMERFNYETAPDSIRNGYSWYIKLYYRGIGKVYNGFSYVENYLQEYRIGTKGKPIVFQKVDEY